MGDIGIGEARERLRIVESRIASIPRWKHGSAEYGRLQGEAQRLRDYITRQQLRSRWIVPAMEGPLSRYKITIPYKKENTS
jgi:hypothetical protein